MEQSRDMSQKQFEAECKRLGFKEDGFMGYYDIGSGRHVSIYNAGKRRRAQLAYLIQQRDREWFSAIRKK